ncbi:MAG: flagellar motor switch protein FliN [Planctomycetaceae bacterium]|nr:flagellar motor switch protein FliN [Planctomycetaceae bacterium]
MSNDNTIDQGEVEKLLAGLGGDAAKTNPPPATTDSGEKGSVEAGSGELPDSGNSAIGQSEVEALLNGKKSSGATENFASEKPAANRPPFSKPSTSLSPGNSAGDADANKMLAQSDIESLLQGTIKSVPSKPGAGIGIPKGEVGNDDPAQEEGVPQGDIDYLLKRAEEALESITSNNGNVPASMPPEVIEFQFPEFGGSVPNSEHATLDQISEVELDIKIELGRTNMYLEDILKLRKGSVVSLDKIAGDAVDIYVNNRLIARGEVLVMNDNFCVRVAELLAGAIPIE